MEQLDVFISIKPKPKQPSKVSAPFFPSRYFDVMLLWSYVLLEISVWKKYKFYIPSYLYFHVFYNVLSIA